MIGKEVAEWIQKKFETYIPVNTLIRRAERQRERNTTNVVKKSKAPTNQASTKTTDLNNLVTKTTKPATFDSGRGGEREGAGRPSCSRK